MACGLLAAMLWLSGCTMVGPDFVKPEAPVQTEWIESRHPEIKTESDLWQIPRHTNYTYQHPTQKPTALAERAINNSSKQGQIVVDLFGGMIFYFYFFANDK